MAREKPDTTGLPGRVKTTARIRRERLTHWKNRTLSRARDLKAALVNLPRHQAARPSGSVTPSFSTRFLRRPGWLKRKKPPGSEGVKGVAWLVWVSLLLVGLLLAMLLAAIYLVNYGGHGRSDYGEHHYDRNRNH